MVVVPTGNLLTETGEQITGTLPSQSSFAEAVNEMTTPSELFAFVRMLFGQVEAFCGVSDTRAHRQTEGSPSDPRCRDVDFAATERRG